MNGYEALRESAAWIDLSARGKICVNGDDRARLLYAITTIIFSSSRLAPAAMYSF
jgi:glycine cleavage system aminomethyltransferase T